MSEEQFLKEKDLLLNCIENNTEEHWENYYKDVPINCIFEDLVIDINEIKRLQDENDKLKKDIHYKRNKINDLKLKLDYALRDVKAQKQVHKHDVDMIDEVKGICVKLQQKIDKAQKKINSMFNEGDENKIIDDLLELESILKENVK